MNFFFFLTRQDKLEQVSNSAWLSNLTTPRMVMQSELTLNSYHACHWADPPNAQALRSQPLFVRTVSKLTPQASQLRPEVSPPVFPPGLPHCPAVPLLPPLVE